MTTPKRPAHIVLIPHAALRDQLLAPHVPGAYRLPEKPEAGWVLGTIVAGGMHYAEDDGWITDPAAGWSEHALVLARDGAVVPEGVDRLCHVDPGYRPWDPTSLTRYLRALIAGESTYTDGSQGQCGSLFGEIGALVLIDDQWAVINVSEPCGATS